jgi:exopolysaccharide biosynthesis polyprenyl glycosylphosphotransferase
MSASGPKVKTRKGRVIDAVVTEPDIEIPAASPVPRDNGSDVPVSSTRTLSDRDLALMEVFCDLLCACIALPLSLILLSQLSSVPVNDLGDLLSNMKVDSLFPVALVLALAVGGAYRVANRRMQPSAFLELRDLSFGVGCGCVLALAIGEFLHGVFGTPEPYATQLVMAVIVAISFITVGRIVLRFFLRRLTTTRVLVVGSGKTADRVMLSVRQEPAMTLVGRAVDGDTVDAGAIGRVTDLPELCRQLDVHRLLVAASEQFSAESLDIYRRLQNSVHIALVPRYYELISWRSRLTDLSGTPFLEIAQPHLSAWDRFAKRAFDLCMSSAVLLAMSPLLLVVAVGVKLSSPGPVCFRQVRLGRSAEPFKVIKFRSMTMDPEADPARVVATETDDPEQPLYELRKKKDETGRITPFGQFLRRTGIDEIPQFINVFKGDMSIVGPRPFVRCESNVEGWARRRFEVRPGITGLWQVSGRNDLTRKDLVELDYLYVASWSLWWDLKIMFETPITMVRGTGAY